VQGTRDAHVGWAYAGHGEFLPRARTFVLDGLAGGHHVEYVGDRPAADLEAELRVFGPVVVQALQAGDATVSTVADYYRFDGRTLVDAPGSVAARLQATGDALDRGRAGLRAVVDATSVARTAEQRAAVGQFEYLVGRAMSVQPLGALCAYDVEQIGPDAAAELACLHPRAESPFLLYAQDDVEGHLAGEIDLSSYGQFERALTHALPNCGADTWVLDCSDLAFIDHHALILLDRFALRAGKRVRLRGCDATLGQVVSLLELDAVTVEPPA
jgi:anti-anti-sigma regulatory factor